MLIVTAGLATAGAPAHGASSRAAGCDGVSALIYPPENVASSSATLVARVSNQGCSFSFSFVIYGPFDTVTTAPLNGSGPDQTSEWFRLPVTGLAPGTTYAVMGLFSANGPSGINYLGPTYRAPRFTALARLDVSLRGAGRVASSPAGIECGAACGVDLPIGGGLSLTATPAPGYRFGHWEGDACAGTSPSCAAFVSSWAQTTAVFDQASLISVAREGNGSGTVTGADGIACGATCSTTVDPGKTITLTAEADRGSRFAGWTGACAGSGATCTFIAAVGTDAVNARFVKQAVLSVRRSGRGVVASDVGGLLCGTICSATLDDGAMVTLRALPARGSVFAGWRGDCVGKNKLCTLTMAGARTVTATFKVKPRPRKKK